MVGDSRAVPCPPAFLTRRLTPSLLASGQRRALPTAARIAPATPTPLAWRVSSTACPNSSTLPLKQRTTFSARRLESRGRSVCLYIQSEALQDIAFHLKRVQSASWLANRVLGRIGS